MYLGNNSLILPCAQNLSGKFYYEETNNTIQKILEGAIKEFELNKLVLGMAAVGYKRVLLHACSSRESRTRILIFNVL